MNSRFLGALIVGILGAGLASAQPPGPVNNTSPPPGPVPGPVGGPVYPAVPTLGGPLPAGPGVIPAQAVAATADDIIVYSGADYLLWQIRRGTLPSTASAIPVGLISVNITDIYLPGGGVVPPAAPAVGFAPVSITNQATFGQGSYTDLGAQNGGRVNFGFWLDTDMSWGLEMSGFFLERGSDRFAALSSQQGNQFLVDSGFQRNVFLVLPTVPGGTTNPLQFVRSFDVFAVREANSSLAGVTSATLYGGELNSRSTFLRVGGFDFAGLAGFRYLNFKDELTLTNNLRLFRPAGFPVTEGDASASLSQDVTFSTRDRTRVWNHFYGGQVGLDLDAKFGACFVNTRIKAGFGNMHQVAIVDSATQVINNDPARPSPAGYGSAGGLLASPADNGRHTRDRFAFIPEIGVKVGYQFADWLRGSIGYNGLYLSHVVRAGNTVVINELNSTVTVAGTSQPVNISQPTFRLRDQDVWVQGATFSLEVAY